MLFILRKLKKEGISRGGVICNYATFCEILFSPYREFFASGFCSESSISLVAIQPR